MKITFALLIVSFTATIAHAAPDEIHINVGMFHTHGDGEADHTGYKDAHYAMKRGRGQGHRHDKSDGKQPHGNRLYRRHEHSVINIWHADHTGLTFRDVDPSEEGVDNVYHPHTHDHHVHIHDVDQHEFRHWHPLLDHYHHVLNDDDDYVPEKKPCPDECGFGCDELNNCLPDPCANCEFGCDEWHNCLPDPCADCLTDCIDDGNGGRRCPDKEEPCVGAECDEETPPKRQPPVRRRTPQAPSGDDETDDDEITHHTTPESTDEMKTPPLNMTYEHTFPAGVSMQHIPLDTDINYACDMFELLGDSIKWSIASRGGSGWTYLKRKTTRHGGYIGKGIGFVTVMREEQTIELSGTFGGWPGTTSQVYHMLYLRENGPTLVGVPVRSKLLATVGDFYKRFDGVTSVQGINPDLEVDLDATRIAITDDWFVELEHDVEIDGTTSYLIESDGADQYSVWGLPWAYEPSSAAPHIRYYRKMALTWGQVKTGLVKDIRELK